MNNNNFILSTSILSADFANLENQIKQVEDAGGDWIHIDVMDGRFVPNITMGPFIVETVKRITKLPIDVHLMINEPEKHVESFIKAGASNLSIHIENNPNVIRTLQFIKQHECNASIVLNPGTPAVQISEVMDFIDMVLVMSVNPGYSGQAFIPQTVKKVAEIREMIKIKNKPINLEIDGGINQETIQSAFNAGANVFVAATAIFKHPDGIHEGIKTLRESIKRKNHGRNRDFRV